jgi:predicted O-methyltransferase YrrM
VFHAIRQSVLDRMRYLEQRQTREKRTRRPEPRTLRNLFRATRKSAPPPGASSVDQSADGYKPSRYRLNQVSPETGRLLALLAAGAPEGAYLEIGTSGGYSTMWIGLACEMLGRSITTFEILPEKIAIARETFRITGIEGIVTIVEGDVRQHLADYDNVAFCFLDTAKEIYAECYEAIVPKMVRGGVLVADNVIGKKRQLGGFVERALADERVDTLVLPVGDGLLLCRKS